MLLLGLIIAISIMIRIVINTNNRIGVAFETANVGPSVVY